MKQAGIWAELDEIEKQQLIDWINESKGTFFATTGNRLQEAIQNKSDCLSPSWNIHSSKRCSSILSVVQIASSYRQRGKMILVASDSTVSLSSMG